MKCEGCSREHDVHLARSVHAAHAGHDLLVNLFPQFSTKFDDLLVSQLQGFPDAVQAVAGNISEIATSELMASRQAPSHNVPPVNWLRSMMNMSLQR